jgi:hypothetical protein
VKAFKALLLNPKNITLNQRRLLRLHFESPGHCRSAQELAETMGYKNFGGVNSQYGTLAHRVGDRLGVSLPPEGFWLFILAEWGDQGPQNETTFILRPEVVEAIKQVWPEWTVGPVQ